MDIETGLTEEVVKQIAKTETEHILTACGSVIDDCDAAEPIVYESLLYIGTLLLKRHMEEILKVQEAYFDHTKAINDKTIETLKSIIQSNKT